MVEEKIIEKTIMGLEIIKEVSYTNWKYAEDSINKEYQAGYFDGLKIIISIMEKEERIEKIINCLFAIQDELESNLKEDKEDEFIANLIGYNESIAFAIKLIQESILKIKEK